MTSGNTGCCQSIFLRSGAGGGGGKGERNKKNPEGLNTASSMTLLQNQYFPNKIMCCLYFIFPINKDWEFICLFYIGCSEQCSCMRLKRSSEKDPIDFNYLETAHRDKRTLAVYLAIAVLQYCVRRDQISCPHYYNNNKAEKVPPGLGIFFFWETITSTTPPTNKRQTWGTRSNYYSSILIQLRSCYLYYRKDCLIF